MSIHPTWACKESFSHAQHAYTRGVGGDHSTLIREQRDRGLYDFELLLIGEALELVDRMRGRQSHIVVLGREARNDVG